MFSQLEIQEVQNSYGQILTCLKDDFITKRIIREGLYERPTVEYILQLLKTIDDPVVFDVGANIGNHSLAFCTVAKQVYSFEPTPVTYNILEKNIKNNQINNIVSVNKGLSNIEDKATIAMVKGNIGMSHINNELPQSSHAIEISLITGDQFVTEQQICQLDFIKIDIEGHEFYAVKGLQQTLARFRPIVLMEWNNQANINNFTGENCLENIFKDYSIFAVGRNCDKSKWRGKPLANIRRKLFKFFNKRKLELFKFPEQIRDNILLVPNEKLQLIETIK